MLDSAFVYCLCLPQGLTIMLDCGIHPGRTGENSLPYFDNGPEASEVCGVSVSVWRERWSRLLAGRGGEDERPLPYFDNVRGGRGIVPIHACAYLAWLVVSPTVLSELIPTLNLFFNPYPYLSVTGGSYPHLALPPGPRRLPALLHREGRRRVLPRTHLRYSPHQGQ